MIPVTKLVSSNKLLKKTWINSYCFRVRASCQPSWKDLAKICQVISWPLPRSWRSLRRSFYQIETKCRYVFALAVISLVYEKKKRFCRAEKQINETIGRTGDIFSHCLGLKPGSKKFYELNFRKPSVLIIYKEFPGFCRIYLCKNIHSKFRCPKLI